MKRIQFSKKQLLDILYYAFKENHLRHKSIENDEEVYEFFISYPVLTKRIEGIFKGERNKNGTLRIKKQVNKA